MRGDLLTRHGHLPSQPAGAPTELVRRANELGAAAGAAVVAALTTFGIAVAVGGEEATSDTWVGALVASLVVAGALTSILAFGTALVARARGARRRLLWLPLSAFPAVAAFLVLGELLWWE